MTISKFLRHDHAYTALTFANAKDQGQGLQDLILYGGAVTEAAPYASPGALVIKPFALQLGGQVIVSDADEAVAYNQPTTPTDTLYLLVSNPDLTDASGLTWTVVTRWSDVEASPAMLFAVRKNTFGEAVWQQPGRSSLRAILHRLEGPLEPMGESGRTEGDRFRVDYDATRTAAPVIVVPPAALADAAGLVASDVAGGLVLPPPHFDGERRDRIVLRTGSVGGFGRVGEGLLGGVPQSETYARENAEKRVATLQVLTGTPRGAGAPDTHTLYAAGAPNGCRATEGSLAIAVNKHLTPQDGSFAQATGYNELYIAYQVDSSDKIRLARLGSDRSVAPSTAVDTTAVEASREEFDVVPLPDGTCLILYTTTLGAGAWTKLYASKVDSAGTAYDFEDQLVYDASVGTASGGTLLANAGIHNPRGFVDEEGNVQIVMEVEMDPAASGGPAFDTAEALFWIKVDASATVISEPVRLTDAGSGTSPAAPVRHPEVAYADGFVQVAAVRDTDVTAGNGEALFLTFTEPSSVTSQVISDSTTVGEAVRGSREIELGSFVSNNVGDVVVGVSPDGRTPVAAWTNEDAASGGWKTYVHYGAPDAPALAKVYLRDDGAPVSALALDFHSNAGSAIPARTPDFDEQVTGLFDGGALYMAGWDSTAGQITVQRSVPHSLHDQAFHGEITSAHQVTQPFSPQVSPSSIEMARAASGEVLIVHVAGSGANQGQVMITLPMLSPGEPEPLLPDIRVLAELDLPPSSASFPLPTLAESARVTEPPRDLVAGGRGGAFVGIAGIRKALGILRPTGGSLRIRAGVYELYEPLNLTSNILVECDPGAIFTTPENETSYALRITGVSLSVSSVSSDGIATISGLAGHPRVLGFQEGAVLRHLSSGDEYFVIGIMEDGTHLKVSDASMPTGAYALCHSGVRWRGGSFIGPFYGFYDLFRAVQCEFSGMRLVQNMPAAAVVGTSRGRGFTVSGCSDISFRDLHMDLGAPGSVFPEISGLAGWEESHRISISGCSFFAGSDIGYIDEWFDFRVVDCVFESASGNFSVVGASSGRIDRISHSGSAGLVLNTTGRVVVGDTDFASQTDLSRSGIYNDTENKPTWTDGHFRGNLYVAGLLNQGQYDLAIMALTMLALDEQVFQMFGMVDGITEDFLDFDDVDGASLYGRWYPSRSPLTLAAPGAGPLQPAQVGLTDLVAPDYFLEKFESVRPMEFFDSAWGLGGRHMALRAVRHHEATSGASFTQAGWPDRGKIEFQGSFDTGGEGRALLGEATAADYAHLQSYQGSAGVDGAEVEFSATRFEVQLPFTVGQQYGDVNRWQRIYDAYTSTENNVIAVASTRVSGAGVNWALYLYIDLFNATTGEHIGGAPIENASGATPEAIVSIHYINTGAGVTKYGELAEVKIVPDLTDSGKAWVFFVGRMWQGDPLYTWESAIRVAHIDLTATAITSANLFVDLPGEPATTKWKNLDSDSNANVRWRGLAVVHCPDDFNASVTGTDNYAISTLTTTWGASTTASWTLRYTIFENAAGDVVGALDSAQLIVSGNIPCAMANHFEQGGQVGNGPIAVSLAGTAVVSESLAWNWNPLSGGFYSGGGDPRLVWVVAYSPNSDTWVGSTLVAHRISWGATDNWDAHTGTSNLAKAATVDLYAGPAVAWDQPSQRFLISYQEGNAFGGSHTQDEIVTTRVRWTASWAWAADTTQRAMGTPLVTGFAGTQKGDPTDAAIDQRLNTCWRGEPAGDADLWGFVQIDTSNVVTLGAWYDSEKPSLVEDGLANLSMNHYWMGSQEWDSGARLAAPASSAGTERDHFLIFHRYDGVNFQGQAWLRCVAPQLVVKCEFDVPWGANLDGTGELDLRAGGSTTVVAGEDPGLTIYPQDGYRSSEDLTNANAAPDQDTYDGTSGTALAQGYPASGAWTGASTATVANPVGAPSKRTLVAVNPTDADFLWTNGGNHLPLERNSTWGTEFVVDTEVLYSFMIGMLVEVDNGTDPATEHRITYLGHDAAGLFGAIVEPPIDFAPDGTPANNTLTFKKEVTGFALIPDTGESSIVHPERIWVNVMDFELERQAQLRGASVDTTPVVPPGSAVCLMSLIDSDGTLAADIAAGGADLADYLTFELSRDNGSTFDTVTFESLTAGGPSPMFQQVQPDGSTLLIVYGIHTWTIGTSTDKDLVYRVTWNLAGTYPGKGLFIDKVVVGWN